MKNSNSRPEITSLNENSFMGLSIEELDARLEMAATAGCWFVVTPPPCKHQCGWAALCREIFCNPEVADSSGNAPATCCSYDCQAECVAYCAADCPCAGGGYCAAYSCPGECPTYCPTHVPPCPAECPTLCIPYSCPTECPVYECTTIYQS